MNSRDLTLSAIKGVPEKIPFNPFIMHLAATIADVDYCHDYVQKPEILADAQIISKKRKTNGHVEIGSTVIIKEGRYKPEEYLIVGAAEANPIDGMISFESPLGSALMGKKTGEKVEVSAPSGSFTVKVVEVK